MVEAGIGHITPGTTWSTPNLRTTPTLNKSKAVIPPLLVVVLPSSPQHGRSGNEHSTIIRIRSAPTSRFLTQSDWQAASVAPAACG